MSALPSMRPCPRPPARTKKRCSPVSGDLTHGSLGVRFDAATGLHYMRARWYDPTIQRIISRDPIGLEGGPNAYVYASNRPVNFVDPSGLWPDAPAGTAPAPTTTAPVPASPQTTTITNIGKGAATESAGALVVRGGLYGLGGYLTYQILKGYLDMEEGKRQARDAQIAEEVTRLRQQAREWRRRHAPTPEFPHIDPPRCDPGRMVKCDYDSEIVHGNQRACFYRCGTGDLQEIVIRRDQRCPPNIWRAPSW